MRQFLSKNSRALLRWLAGGIQPANVGLAVWLGVLAGFVTGGNLLILFVLLLAIVWNVHARSFCMAWCGGGALSWSLLSIRYRAGWQVFERTGLGELLAPWRDSPVLVALDLDRYVTVGGLLLGAVLGLPAALAAAELTRRYFPRPMDELLSTKRVRPLGPLPRLLGAVLLGPPSTAFPPGPRHARPFSRPWGITGAVAFGVLVCLWGYWQAPRYAAARLMTELSRINQAEVNADAVQLSLWNGELEITGLAIADPRRPERDRLRIGRASGRIDPWAMLAGRLESEKLDLAHLRGDVARRRPARTMVSHEAPDDGLAYREAISHDRAHAGAAADAIRCQDAIRDWDVFLGRLQVVRHLIVELESIGRHDAPAVAGLADLDTDDAAPLVARRCYLGQRKPRLAIQEIRLEEVAPHWGLGSTALMEITNLASRPPDVGPPTQILLTAPKYSAKLTATLNLRQPGQRHDLALVAYGVSLVDFLADRPGAPRIDHGVVNLGGEGWADRDALHLNLQVDARELDVRLDENGSWAGVAADVWSEGIKELAALRADLSFAGPWHGPSLTAPPHRIVSQFKHQLRAAGAHDTVAKIIISNNTASNRTVSNSAVSNNTVPNSNVPRITVEKVDDAAAPNVDAHEEKTISTAAADAESGAELLADIGPSGVAATPEDAPPEPAGMDDGRDERSAAYEFSPVYPRTSFPDTWSLPAGGPHNPLRGRESALADKRPIAAPVDDALSHDPPRHEAPRYDATRYDAPPHEAPRYTESTISPDAIRDQAAFAGAPGSAPGAARTESTPPDPNQPGPIDLVVGYDTHGDLARQSRPENTPIPREPTPDEVRPAVGQRVGQEVGRYSVDEPTITHETPPSPGWAERLRGGVLSLWPFGGAEVETEPLPDRAAAWRDADLSPPRAEPPQRVDSTQTPWRHRFRR